MITVSPTTDLDTEVDRLASEILEREKALCEVVEKRITAQLRAWRPEGGTLETSTYLDIAATADNTVAITIDRVLDGDHMPLAPADDDSDTESLLGTDLHTQLSDDLNVLASYRQINLLWPKGTQEFTF